MRSARIWLKCSDFPSTNATSAEDETRPSLAPVLVFAVVGFSMLVFAGAVVASPFAMFVVTPRGVESHAEIANNTTTLARGKK